MIADLHIHYPIHLITGGSHRHTGIGSDVAEQICSGNALRLLRTHWRPGT